MNTKPAEDVLAPVPPDDQSVRPPLKALALPLICVAQLMATLDVTIVNLSLPVGFVITTALAGAAVLVALGTAPRRSAGDTA